MMTASIDIKLYVTWQRTSEHLSQKLSEIEETDVTECVVLKSVIAAEQIRNLLVHHFFTIKRCREIKTTTYRTCVSPTPIHAHLKSRTKEPFFVLLLLDVVLHFSKCQRYDPP